MTRPPARSRPDLDAALARMPRQEDPDLLLALARRRCPQVWQLPVQGAGQGVLPGV